MSLHGKAFIHNIRVFIDTEDADLDVTHAAHPVERGVDVTDHTEREPIIVKLSGKLTRDSKSELEKALQKLYEYEKKGTFVVYKGRRIYKNMQLAGLTIKADSSVMNGYLFSCTLTEKEVATSSFVGKRVRKTAQKKSSSGYKQNKNKKLTNVTHTVKKGDTYWGLSQKYGCTIAELRKWNKYADTKIPVGARLKVK